MYNLSDKDGNVVRLHSETIVHIRNEHLVEDPLDFIKDVLKSPSAIIESKWKRDTHLFYKKQKKKYHVVVMDVKKRIVKTAYIEGKIKEGRIIWLSQKMVS